MPADALGGGIADTFRSDRTPDFGEMAASLFGGSDSRQRKALGGAALAIALGQVAQRMNR